MKCRNPRYPEVQRETVRAKPCDGVIECLDDEDEATCGYNFTYILGNLDRYYKRISQINISKCSIGLVAFVVVMSIGIVELFMPFLGYLLSDISAKSKNDKTFY